jgi:hypothetical protein
MVAQLRASAILQGARGGPALAVQRVHQALLSIGGSEGLMLTHPDDIAEIDINPLVVTTDAAIAVDARVVLHPR